MNIKNSAGDAFRGAEFIDGFGNEDNKESTDHQGFLIKNFWFNQYRRKRPKVDASIFDSALSHTRR